jgi:hypothetical protein
MQSEGGNTMETNIVMASTKERKTISEIKKQIESESMEYKIRNKDISKIKILTEDFNAWEHDNELIKIRLSEDVISKIQDKSIQNIVRGIIFGNPIDWHHANKIINREMPELIK